MSHKDLDYLIPRIALAEAKHIGPRYARLFLDKLGSVEAIFSGADALRKAFPRQNERLISELYRSGLIQRARDIAQWSLNEGVEIYFVGDEDYPFRLKQCPDAPVVLYAKGEYKDWENPLALSVVGTRNITGYGQMMTDRLLRELKAIDSNTLIVSGLAYGVDVTAHRKALELGLPTVAVLAHGFDRIYPAAHYRTAQEILSHGAWVSEYPPGTRPDKFNFVARNRIIAGMTSASLIVEAGLRSGSLITANLARDYDREVLVVPGKVGDKYSEGCNQLIAKMIGLLVTSGDDIAKAMGWEQRGDAMQGQLEFEQAEPAPIDNPVYNMVATNQPIQLNDIVRRTGLSVSEVTNYLFDLELDGYISAMPGGMYALSR